jgi:hypothetical protein
MFFVNKQTTGDDVDLHHDDECIGLALIPDRKSEYVKSEATTTTVENLDVSATQEINIQRDTWSHQAEFLLAIIGYTVDLGEIHSLIY